VEAWVEFAVILLVSGFIISLSNLHPTGVTFGVLSFPLHFLYPLSKRWIWCPQLWLGLSNAWSFLIGWFAIAGHNSTHTQIKACLVMYFAMICWTIFFDTIYANQDKTDDARIGIGSTALLFGKHIREYNAALAALVIVSLVVVGALNRYGPLYFLISCLGSAVHFAWQMFSWDVNDLEQTERLFKANGDWGLIVFLGIIADRAVNSTWGLSVAWGA